MTKLNQDLDMFQGEDKVITVPVTDSDGDPLVMTGGAVTYQWFLKKSGASAVVEKTTDDDIIFVNVDDTDDGVQITLAAADTNSLLPGKYYHECRVTLSGNSEVVFEGRVNLRRSRTTS